jgi:hypothetical protein
MTLTIGILGLAEATPAMQTQLGKPARLHVAAVVGCVAQDGANWILTSATGPLVVPVGDGKVQTGSSITVEKAKAQAVGKERYRLINTLDEFGMPTYKGQRVLVKGIVLGEGKDRRINMVSIESVAPACGARQPR